MEFSISSWVAGLNDLVELIGPAELTAELLGDDLAPSLVARLVALSTAEHPRAAELHQIHSELTPRERHFLLGWFTRRWSGGGQVVEVGPFLGSSSRAIALGMLANPRRRTDARLVTYDRFCDYYTTPQQLAPLRRCLPGPVVDEIAATGSFRRAFDVLHESTDYGTLIEARVGVLADEPAQLGGSELLRLDDQPISTLFVDGAKSWFGTKHLMLEAAPLLQVGSTIIFQDYGHYTCFWLPAMASALRSHLRLVAAVDDTYTFTLVEPLSAGLVDELYPDHPAQWSIEHLELTFAERSARAMASSDTYGLLSLELQRAAALAYVGEGDRAADIIDAAAQVPAFRAYRAKIAAARRSPTYRPDGPIMLEPLQASAVSS